jgi:hypothetical protein
LTTVCICALRAIRCQLLLARPHGDREAADLALAHGLHAVASRRARRRATALTTVSVRRSTQITVGVIAAE